MSIFRLDAVTEKVSLYHGGASVHVRSGYTDGHVEFTVNGCGAPYIVTPDLAEQPVTTWPRATAVYGASIDPRDWNPVEAQG